MLPPQDWSHQAEPRATLSPPGPTPHPSRLHTWAGALGARPPGPLTGPLSPVWLPAPGVAVIFSRRGPDCAIFAMTLHGFPVPSPGHPQLLPWHEACAVQALPCAPAPCSDPTFQLVGPSPREAHALVGNDMAAPPSLCSCATPRWSSGHRSAKPPASPPCPRTPCASSVLALPLRTHAGCHPPTLHWALTCHLTVSVIERQQKRQERQGVDGQDGGDGDTGREAGPAWSSDVDAREAPSLPGARAPARGF